MSGVGGTHDLEAGIHVPKAELGILDLEADHTNQCWGADPGKIFLTYPEFNERVVFQESDAETHVAKDAPPTRLVKVSNETAQFLKEKCSKRIEGADRLSSGNVYALPKVLATKSSVLDAYLKPEASQSVKAADKELGLIQSAVLDAVAPLTSIV